MGSPGRYQQKPQFRGGTGKLVDRSRGITSSPNSSDAIGWKARFRIRGPRVAAAVGSGKSAVEAV